MNSKMKTITLFFFIVFGMGLTANAQITKGNWMVGGTGSFTNTDVRDEIGNEIGNSSQVRLNPNIGYFFFDKFATGLIGQFIYGKAKNGPSNSDYGIGPFARYYFLKSDNQINLFVDGSYVYYSSNGSFYNFKAGPVLYFNNSVGLELTFGYGSTKFTGDYQLNEFRVGLGFQIHLEK